MIESADAVISVCEMNHSPLWANKLPKDGNMKDFLKDDILGKRRQDLPTYYRINGGIYICKTRKLLEEETYYIKDNIYAYKMDRMVSLDIDDKDDFEISEIIAKSRYTN